MGQEKLGSIGVRTRICHRKNARFIVLERGVELVTEGKAGTATTGTSGVASLSHEIWNHPVENCVVVIALTCQENKIVNRIGHFTCK